MIDTDAITEVQSPVRQRNGTRISRTLIAKSVLSNWSFLTLNVLVAFWMTPFVVHHLGDSSYGIWALILQLTGYMGVVDVGLRSALVRFVSRFRAQDDHGALNRLLNNTFALYVLMAPLCFAVAIVVSAFALPHMHIPSGTLRVAQITVFISAACVACDFIFATCHAALAGLSRWDLINGVSTGVLLSRTVLVVVALKLGFGLLTLALIQFSITLVGYSVETFLLHRLLPTFRFKLQKPDLPQMRPVMEHGWYSFLLSLANRINYQVDSVVIAFFLPIGEVTFYVVGLRLIEYLRELLNSTTIVVAPLVSSYEAVGETHRVADTLIRGTKYSLFVGFLGAASFLAIGTDFIRLWMGSRFAGPSGTVLVILAIGVLSSSTQFASSQVLFGLSKHRLNVRWTIVEAIFNLCFSLALVRRYGIFGVAAGTTIANIIVRGCLYPRSFLRALQVPLKEYLQRGILPTVVPTLAFLAGAMLCKHLFPIHNYGGLVLSAICGLFPFAVCLWLFGLDDQDRELIRRKSGQLVARA